MQLTPKLIKSLRRRIMKQTTLRLNAKTFTLLLLSVLFSLILAVPAFAAEAIYIPKLEMYITMPDDWIVFNEPLDENDSIFEDWD